MIIGVPKEIKTKESRVAVTPTGVKQLVQAGHTVYVERDAGTLSGFNDEAYTTAGAKLASAENIWKTVGLIVKVKEPLDSEYKYFRSDLNIFTYLHLAGIPQLASALCETKVTAIGYETVEFTDVGEKILLPQE